MQHQKNKQQSTAMSVLLLSKHNVCQIFFWNHEMRRNINVMKTINDISYGMWWCTSNKTKIHWMNGGGPFLLNQLSKLIGCFIAQPHPIWTPHCTMKSALSF